MVLLNTSLATTVSVDPQLLAHSSTSTALMSVQRMLEQLADNSKIMSSKSEQTRERILEAAIRTFASAGKAATSLVDVAHAADISSQGIYRYFRNKDELFSAAVEYDIDALVFTSLKTISQLPAPLLGGGFWETFVKIQNNFPLAMAAINSREPVSMKILSSCESIQLLKAALRIDIIKGFELEFIRQDVDPEALAISAGFVMVEISIPLATSGRFNTDDWFSIQATVLAAGFYPVPDFQDPEIVTVFQMKMMALGLNSALKDYKFN